LLHREFCSTCGSPLMEFGVCLPLRTFSVAENDNANISSKQFECPAHCWHPPTQANAGDFIYIFNGTFDKPTDLPPKGEFFCRVRDSWMPEIPGIFHKREINEWARWREEGRSRSKQGCEEVATCGGRRSEVLQGRGRSSKLRWVRRNLKREMRHLSEETPQVVLYYD